MSSRSFEVVTRMGQGAKKFETIRKHRTGYHVASKYRWRPHSEAFYFYWGERRRVTRNATFLDGEVKPGHKINFNLCLEP